MALQSPRRLLVEHGVVEEGRRLDWTAGTWTRRLRAALGVGEVEEVVEAEAGGEEGEEVGKGKEGVTRTIMMGMMM